MSDLPIDDGAGTRSQSNTRPIVVRREYIPLAGDLVTAILLSQIAYWYRPAAKGGSKLQVSRAGHWWIAKTRQEWMAETGLTLKQYRRSVSILKKKGLIEVRQMLFRNLNVSHLRLLVSLPDLAGGGDATNRVG